MQWLWNRQKLKPKIWVSYILHDKQKQNFNTELKNTWLVSICRIIQNSQVTSWNHDMFYWKDLQFDFSFSQITEPWSIRFGHHSSTEQELKISFLSCQSQRINKYTINTFEQIIWQLESSGWRTCYRSTWEGKKKKRTIIIWLQLQQCQEPSPSWV